MSGLDCQDIICGWGRDRPRFSIAVTAGDVGDPSGTEGTRPGLGQGLASLSGRLSGDWVEGALIFGPRIGMDFTLVAAEERRSVSVPTSYTVDVTRTRAETNRGAVVGGCAVGLGAGGVREKWFVGLQAIVEAGFDIDESYAIRRFSGERVPMAWEKGLSLRAGGEFLAEPYWFGEEPGLGVITGLYWMRNENLITREAQGGLQFQLGLSVPFK